jgi:hypothetical protein
MGSYVYEVEKRTELSIQRYSQNKRPIYNEMVFGGFSELKCNRNSDSSMTLKQTGMRTDQTALLDRRRLGNWWQSTARFSGSSAI